MAINLEGIVTWLSGWFYKKEEVNTIANSKLNANLTTANKNLVTNGSGDVVLEDKPVIPDVSGFIDTAGTGLSKSGTTLNHSNSVTVQTSTVFKKIKYDGQGHITGTADVSANDLPIHAHSADKLIDQNSNNYSNIGITTSWAEQGDINSAINTAIGNLQSIKAIEVVSTLPTASASTMGKLYIISENSKINVYYTTQSGSTYSWHKMDADILDELSIDWSDVQNKPSTFTPSSHTHGYINNDGTITTSSGGGSNDDPVVVTSSDNKIRRVSALYVNKVTDSTANYPNINIVGIRNQKQINTAIDTAIGNIQSNIITSIALVPKNTDANGKIIFYTGDEPSNS